MTTTELAGIFKDNHNFFVDYINSLSESEFTFSNNNKWTPGQQLDHVLKCNQPLAQILNNKSVIEQKFGTVNRAVMNYDELIKTYKASLANGGKAPERFVPGEINFEKRAELTSVVLSDLASIAKSLDNYSEAELDTLVLPHPLLGPLAIREMLYLMSYHALHHLEKTKEGLETFSQK